MKSGLLQTGPEATEAAVAILQQLLGLTLWEVKRNDGYLALCFRDEARELGRWAWLNVPFCCRYAIAAKDDLPGESLSSLSADKMEFEIAAIKAHKITDLRFEPPQVLKLLFDNEMMLTVTGDMSSRSRGWEFGTTASDDQEPIYEIAVRPGPVLCVKQPATPGRARPLLAGATVVLIFAILLLLFGYLFLYS